MDIMSFPSVEGMVRNDGKMTPKQMYDAVAFVSPAETGKRRMEI